MKMHSASLARLLACACVLVLAGCSTPQTRIRANPEIFSRLTPEQQAMVRAGHIGLGFDFDAVKLALGDPDRITVRTDADGETVIWHYLTYEAGGRVLFTGYYHSGRAWWGGAAYPYYLDYPNRHVHDRFRVQFRTGKVVAITQEN